MSHDVQLDSLLGGYVVDFSDADSTATIVTREFRSSDEGEVFLERMEGIPRLLLSRLPPEAKVSPSTLDHMVAVIRRDLTATVYVNEVKLVATTLLSRDVETIGEAIVDDDIADISELNFDGVDVPPDAGVVFVFSFGWRKGLFF